MLLFLVEISSIQILYNILYNIIYFVSTFKLKMDIYGIGYLVKTTYISQNYLVLKGLIILSYKRFVCLVWPLLIR